MSSGQCNEKMRGEILTFCMDNVHKMDAISNTTIIHISIYNIYIYFLVRVYYYYSLHLPDEIYIPPKC